jgi:flavin reductase (DIM6/NTAB) family NADH-FMN oxidoreductase RutF
MPKRSVKPFRPIYPTPAGLITSVADDGRANIITLGEVHNLSIAKPVIVGIAIARPRHSHGLIRRSGEFVVNLPTTSMLRQVDRCGTTSGRDVDKFEAFGLTALPATRVRPPLIAECPLNLERKLLDVQEWGDHDLFVGEVLVEHADEAVLDANGKLQIDRLDVLCYVHGEYWSLGERLGTHGFTRKDGA